VVLLDTSVLVDSLTGSKRSASRLRTSIARGERLLVPALVLYEWLRGPRLPAEIAVQEALFPNTLALPFGPAEAAISAHLYRKLRRPRGREVDLAIAACALNHDGELWTLNRADFTDIPALRLYLAA
jgi:predicted nucleic acid-binding protein